MTTADIEALYTLALAGDAAARDRLSDAAGKIIGLTWDRWQDDRESDSDWYDYHDGRQHHGDERWRVNGRHAPLVSLDCAASVPMPEYNYGLHIWPVRVDPYVRVVTTHAAMDVWFRYTDPAHRALAECCARLWAEAHAREAV